MDFGSQTRSNSAAPSPASHLSLQVPQPLPHLLLSAVGTGVWAYTACALTLPLSVPECCAESRAIEFGPWMPQGTCVTTWMFSLTFSSLVPSPSLFRKPLAKSESDQLGEIIFILLPMGREWGNKASPKQTEQKPLFYVQALLSNNDLLLPPTHASAYHPACSWPSLIVLCWIELVYSWHTGAASSFIRGKCLRHWGHLKLNNQQWNKRLQLGT